AGTPPFWRILKGVPDAARRKPSNSGNTSFLERMTVNDRNKLGKVWIRYPVLLDYTLFIL
ncbi:MAG: hypothetical protein J6E48_09180, partial [Prevotella sp.]|nr:hypothetical protein [Prevotella sp.]